MPGEAGVHRALEDDHALGLVDVEDRHPVDRRGGVRVRGRVRHVVGADHERHVGAAELRVDVVHLLELVVRHVGLGEQDVHVAGHAAGDRVDRVLDLDAALLELVGELLARCAAPARRPCRSPGTITTQTRVRHLDRGVRGARGAHRAGVLAGARGALDRSAAAEAAGDDRRDRAVHRLGHQAREDRAGRADDHARDDQRGVVQRKPGRGRGEAGERVQQRDHDRHVGAADRQHDEQPEQRRGDQHDRDPEARCLAGRDRDRPRRPRRRAAAG